MPSETLSEIVVEYDTRGLGRAARQLRQIEGTINRQERAFNSHTNRVERASRGMSRFGRSIQAVGGAVRSFDRRLRVLGGTVSRMTTRLVTLASVGAGLAATFTTIRQGIEFEESFTNVAKVVEGLGGNFTNLTERGEQMRGSFVDLTREIPKSASELAEFASIGGRLGVPTEQLGRFSETVARLAVSIDGIPAEQAAESLGRLNFVADEGRNRFEALGNAVVGLGNNFATSEGQILSATGQIFRFSEMADASADQVLALAAALREAGQRPQAVAGSFQAIFQTISESIAEGSEKLPIFADLAEQSVERFTEAFEEDAFNAMMRVLRGIAQLQEEGQNITSLLQTLELEGRRAAGVIAALGGNFDRVQEAIALANDELEDGNALVEESEKFFGTLANQLEFVTNAIDRVQLAVARDMNPAVRELATEMVAVLDRMATLIDEAPNLRRGLENALVFLREDPEVRELSQQIGSVIGTAIVTGMEIALQTIPDTIKRVIGGLIGIRFGIPGAAAGAFLGGRADELFNTFVSRNQQGAGLRSGVAVPGVDVAPEGAGSGASRLQGITDTLLTVGGVAAGAKLLNRLPEFAGRLGQRVSPGPGGTAAEVSPTRTGGRTAAAVTGVRSIRDSFESGATRAAATLERFGGRFGTRAGQSIINALSTQGGQAIIRGLSKVGRFAGPLGPLVAAGTTAATAEQNRAGQAIGSGAGVVGGAALGAAAAAPIPLPGARIAGAVGGAFLGERVVRSLGGRIQEALGFGTEAEGEERQLDEAQINQLQEALDRSLLVDKLEQQVTIAKATEDGIAKLAGQGVPSDLIELIRTGQFEQARAQAAELGINFRELRQTIRDTAEAPLAERVSPEELSQAERLLGEARERVRQEFSQIEPETVRRGRPLAELSEFERRLVREGNIDVSDLGLNEVVNQLERFAPERATELRENEAVQRRLRIEREQRRLERLGGPGRAFPEGARLIQQGREELRQFQQELPEPGQIRRGRQLEDLSQFERQLVELAKLDIATLSGREVIEQLRKVDQGMAEQVESSKQVQSFLQAVQAEEKRQAAIQEQVAEVMRDPTGPVQPIPDTLALLNDQQERTADAVEETNRILKGEELADQFASRAAARGLPVGTPTDLSMSGDGRDASAPRGLGPIPGPQPVSDTPALQSEQASPTAPQASAGSGGGNTIQLTISDLGGVNVLQHLSRDQLRALLQDPQVTEDMRQAIEDVLNDRAQEMATKVMK